MTASVFAAGLVARNFEVSFLFPDADTEKIRAFLTGRLAGYHYRRYRITDLYFPLDADGAEVMARQRTEGGEHPEIVNLIIPCKAHRYLVVPGQRPASAEIVLVVEKLRDDWTRRSGPRLRGKHYGSFSRVSLDTAETGALPDGKPCRTFPGMTVVEFEYAGSGKAEIDRLVAAFKSFCHALGIELADRPRGIAHRIEILSRALPGYAAESVAASARKVKT